MRPNTTIVIVLKIYTNTYVALFWVCLHVTTSKHYIDHFIITFSCINDTGSYKQLL